MEATTKTKQTPPKQTKATELTAKVFGLTGQSVGNEKLDPTIFAVDINPDVVSQAIIAQQANSRVALAHTKTRSEVKGGGKKPWRQKGTGRARHGSIRSPLWSGGGVTFGPSKIRNFSVKINRKVRRAALRMVLTDKAKASKVIILESLEMSEIKAKQLTTLVGKLGLIKKSGKPAKVLLVSDKQNRKAYMSARNLANITYINVASLNVIDLMKHDHILLAQAALPKVKELYG